MNHLPQGLRKLLLIALISAACFAQPTWANIWECHKPQVAGYTRVSCLSEGLAWVQKDGKWGYINKTGKVVIPLQYDDAYSFYEGLAVVKKDGKYGFINKTGNIIVPLQYDDVGAFYEGLAWVYKDGEEFYINKQGQRVD